MKHRQISRSLPKKRSQYFAQKPVSSRYNLIRSYFIKLIKLSVVAVVLFLFSGYHPVLGFPPLKRSVALADFSQSQDIKSADIHEPFRLPHTGYISTHFSAWHPGVDIAVSLGTTIHPVLSGKVVDVVYGFIDLGHEVIVEHAQGYRSIYGHMGKIKVKVGDTVTPDSALGEVGLTGHTSGPHTHLEITHNGSHVDPLTLIPDLPTIPASFSATPTPKSI